MQKTRARSISLMLFPCVKALVAQWQVLEAPSQRCSTHARLRVPDAQRVLRGGR